MTSTAQTIAEENAASAGAFEGHDRLIATRKAARRVASRLALPWTLGMIAVGMATLAACVLVPLREENRQLAHEFDRLQSEATFVRQQVEANSEFMSRVHSDPALAERLAMRATRKPVAGKKFLDAEQVGDFSASPYALTRIAAPEPLPEYKSDLPPAIVRLFGDTRSRVVMIGASLFLVAAAVILGKTSSTEAGSVQTSAA